MSDRAVILPDSFRDPYRFDEVLKTSLPAPVIDMSRIRFVEPYSMLAFIMLGREYLRSSGEKTVLKNVSVPILQYLHRMDFHRSGYFTMTQELDPRMMLKRSSFSRRVIEVTAIPAKEQEGIKAISDIISLFRERAQHILKYWVSESIVEYFITVISELCQNIFEHSLDSGYLAMQTYSHDRENVVQLAIVDSGIGIRKSFEYNRNTEIESTSQLIHEAITTPVSSKRKFGYGLCQVNNIVERLNGDIFIRSGDGLAASIKNNRKSSDYFFLKDGLIEVQGTWISMTLTTGG